MSPRWLAQLLLALSACAAKQPWHQAMAPGSEVFVDVLPRSAEVRLDGRTLGRGSFSVPLGTGPAALEVMAQGFEREVRVLDPRRQVGERVGVALRPIAFGEGRKLDADEPTGLASAAAALLRRGSAAHAVEYAERAAELAPQWPEAHRILGLALRKMPQTRQIRIRAAQELSAYLASAPDATDRIDITRAIEELRGDISIPVRGSD
jgi:hypothetical protein